MLLRKTILTLCVTCSVTSLGQAQVKFERKFQEGSKYTAETTSKVEQKLSIAGMDTDSANDSRTTTKVTVGKRDDAGQISTQEKVESMTVTIKVMGTEYQFDSNAPDNKGTSPYEMLRDLHKTLARRTSTTVFDKNNRVARIESDQDLLSGLPDNVKTLVKGQVDPEAQKEAANKQLDLLPSDPVNKGDSWERSHSANLGAGQIMTFQFKFTYEGEIEKEGRKLDKITAKTLSVDLSLKDSPLPLTIKSCQLKPQKSEETILFDRQLGQTVESKSVQHIVGDITFEVNKMELPSKLDLLMETTTLRKR